MKIRKMKTYQIEFFTAAIVIVLVVGGLAYSFASMPPSDDSSDDIELLLDRAGSADSTPKAMQRSTPVVLAEARAMSFERSITVSGSIQAKRFALVSARVPGTLDAVFVDEGDVIEANKTELFQTDSVKLSKAVAIARQELTVSQCAVQEKQAMFEKSAAVKQQAENDLRRSQELLGKNAMAIQEVEKVESQYKQCEADVKHVRALIDLATAQWEQAKLNVTIAEKDMADSLVVSPICGRVSERLCEPGEMAGAGTAVLRIEDLSLLEVSVYLPAEYYAEVIPNQTAMRVRVGDTDLETRMVSYKSPTVTHQLRTFKVEGLIESPPPCVVPGCLAEVTIVTDRREGIGVPAEAVQNRAGHSVVFAVQGERAVEIEVETGRHAEGQLEIVRGLDVGTAVVAMGQTLIENGSPVSIVQEQSL
ncbi:efflux RND transporter periplasmic adaptor subunit [Novipirellula artificiosorum]|uniref:Multidrug resistance protein MdtA n=1 Tax=Novipirellula artificiosorum TaxID=2528016 RepID=A0A5C6E0N0_9BACT|nr:efflux RND transporter periplasmic adaptor subunit [Novipirellula artificiosorum]TWU42468.1 Multidrug resistance protein MdtA precursor [Novipirellula artificiosorum]